MTERPSPAHTRLPTGLADPGAKRKAKVVVNLLKAYTRLGNWNEWERWRNPRKEEAVRIWLQTGTQDSNEMAAPSNEGPEQTERPLPEATASGPAASPPRPDGHFGEERR